MNEPCTNGHVYIESLDGKKLFFDFWKIPYLTDTNREPTVSIVNGTDLKVEYGNALVLLSDHSEPQLYHLGNGIHIFAKVRRLENYPNDLDVIAPVLDKKGHVVSFILEDRKKKTVYLPFTLDEVFEGFYYEKYIDANRKTFLPKPILDFYYLLKPFLPNSVRSRGRANLARIQGKREFPRWPLDTSFEDFKRFVLELLLKVSRTKELPFLWFWPENKEACLVLTHDVESGLTNNGGIHRIISIEQKHRFRSSFNIVPFKYEIDKEVMTDIKSHGCEIGVHGYSHDGKLFSNYQVFEKRMQAINTVAKTWDATGFRSCSTYRNPDWCELMEFDYDCSFFDTDPYEPQPGGCLSLFPYFIGKIVEIPMTMPQDHTLLALLVQKDIKIWREKAQEIRRRNGSICLNTHPDEGYIGDEDKQKHYIELIDSLAVDDQLWNPLPRDVAIWWRKRHEAQVIMDGGNVEIENNDPDISIRWATLENGKLKFAKNA